MSLLLLYIQIVWSEFGVNNIKAWIHPGGVMVGGIFSWHTLCTNGASCKTTAPEYCCWPYPLSYDHIVHIFSGCFQQDKEPYISGFLDMTVSSRCTIFLHSHQISIQYSATGMCFNRWCTCKSAAVAWCCHVNTEQTLLANISTTFISLCR